MSRDRNARPAITSSSGMGDLLSASYRDARETSGKMLRARLFDIGIQALDNLAVALLNHAPLQLHRKSQLAVRDGEIFGQQRKSLRSFVLRQAPGLALEFARE